MREDHASVTWEMLEQCSFWGTFTGEVRRKAESPAVRAYWVLRVLLRGLILCLRLPQHLRRRHAAGSGPCDILAIFVTENQRRAFFPWLKQLEGVQTASWMEAADWYISWYRCGLLSLRYLLPVYAVLRRRPDCARIIPWLEEFVRYRVGVRLAAELYERARPRVVAVSNDHSGMFRAFIVEARRRGCKVIYSQHASIGRHLPVLDFDLSLLDGTQAYLHYRDSGPPLGQIVITGRNRLVDSGQQTATERRKIGLATNWDDPLLTWLPLLRRVRSRFADVALRCHPAETRKRAWRVLCALTGVRFESGRLDDFLQGTAVLISGVSGVILDAALHGIPCLLKLPPQRKSEVMSDYFGFERFGLCTRIPSLEALPELISKTLGRRIESDRVSVYEAGLVQDPTEEKRAALALFMLGVGEGTEAERLMQRYRRVLHEGTPVFMSAAYAELNRKHGWLTTTSSAY
jgi:hypothetical protein